MIGLSLKWFFINLKNYPFLTLLSQFSILINFFVQITRTERFLNFLNKFELRLRLPNNKKIFCRFPELVTINEIYLSKVYDLFPPEENSLIFDVGAHIGLYSLKFSNLPKTKIIAIEPYRENFKLLTKNLKINNVKNVIPVNSLVLDKSTFVNFYSLQFFPASSIFPQRLDKLNKTIKMKAITLDELFKKYKKYNKIFIKLDVEGSELKVLKGAKEILKNSKVKVIIEVHTKYVREQDLINFLKKFHFDKIKIINLNYPYITAQKSD